MSATVGDIASTASRVSDVGPMSGKAVRSPGVPIPVAVESGTRTIVAKKPMNPTAATTSQPIFIAIVHYDTSENPLSTYLGEYGAKVRRRLHRYAPPPLA